MVVWLLIGLFMIFAGLSVHVFKWYFLIAGYNTMPKAKKANVDIASVGRLMGYWGYLNGGVCILLGLMAALGMDPADGVIPALIIFGVSTIFLLIRAQKYDHNVSSSKGGLAQSGRLHQYGSIGVTIVSLVVVGILMLYFIQPTQVTIADQGLIIRGLYGGTYPWDAVASAQLVEELPRLARRTNGAAIGSHLRGYFRTSEGETIKLFVDSKQPPFIRIVTEDQVLYLNLKTPVETRQAAAAIEERLQP